MQTDRALPAYVPFLPAVKAKQPQEFQTANLHNYQENITFYKNKFQLSCVVDGAGLTYDGYLDLAGVGHLILYLQSYLR